MTSPILQSTTGEAYPQRSGVTNTMRSRIVRIGAKISPKKNSIEN